MGLSQEDLADDAGVSSNYLAKLETGKREPGLKVLMKLANVLEVSKEDIVTVVTQDWPSSDNIEASTEFNEFKPNIQKLLVEIGYLVQKFT